MRRRERERGSEEVGEGFVGGFEALGDGGVCDVALEGVHAGDKFGEEVGGFLEAVAGEGEGVAQGGVGEGEGGGAGDGAGHVGDAVVDDAIDDVGGVVVGGGFAGLDAAALIDGDIDDDAAGGHAADHVAVDEFGGFGAGDEHGTDDEVGFADGGGDVVGVGVDGVEGASEDVVEVVEAGQVDVHDADASAHADGDFCGVGADDAAAQDDDATARDAGDAAEQDAFAAEAFFEAASADLGGEPPGDFAHGAKQRQGFIGELDGLVGDGGDALFEEDGQQLRHSGQVKVCVNGLVVLDAGVLVGQGFFDLDDHLGRGPHVVGGGEELCACVEEVVVGDVAAQASALLDKDGVASLYELAHASRHKADTKLLALNLFRDTDLQSPSPLAGVTPAEGRARACWMD